MADKDLAVKIQGLTRVYQSSRRSGTSRAALDRLDLQVRAGEVRGLLGPNGAGKTTLCKILSTVLLPTSGHAWVYGRNVATEPAAVRPLVGIVFGGERGLYTRLTARQNLSYWAALYRLPRRAIRSQVAGLLERVGLSGRANERVETFSRGMKQRLHLARGLVGDPRLVILDEPTMGLDPVAARQFRVLVSELRDEGRTILLTTHDMTEAESVCDRVSLIDNGRLLRTEDPRAIGLWLSKYERVEAEEVPEAVVAALRDVPGVKDLEMSQPGTIRVHTAAEGAAGQVLRLLLDAGVTTMRTARPSLEEVYLHVIGKRGMSL